MSSDPPASEFFSGLRGASEVDVRSRASAGLYDGALEAEVASDEDLGIDLDAAQLAEVDALFDRLGARAPLSVDLDDDLIATLAVLAAEVDLDVVPVQVTRRALHQCASWPPVVAPDANATTRPLDQAALSLAVQRQRALAQSSPSSAEGPGEISVVSELTAGARTTHVGRGSGAASPGGRVGFGDPARAVRVRLLPAVAATGGALVLSMGAAAALTGGESLNPVTAVRGVVDQINHPPPETVPTAPTLPRSSSPAGRASGGSSRHAIGGAIGGVEQSSHGSAQSPSPTGIHGPLLPLPSSPLPGPGGTSTPLASPSPTSAATSEQPIAPVVTDAVTTTPEAPANEPSTPVVAPSETPAPVAVPSSPLESKGNGNGNGKANGPVNGNGNGKPGDGGTGKAPRAAPGVGKP